MVEFPRPDAPAAGDGSARPYYYYYASLITTRLHENKKVYIILYGNSTLFVDAATVQLTATAAHNTIVGHSTVQYNATNRVVTFKTVLNARFLFWCLKHTSLIIILYILLLQLDTII